MAESVTMTISMALMVAFVNASDGGKNPGPTYYCAATDGVTTSYFRTDPLTSDPKIIEGAPGESKRAMDTKSPIILPELRAVKEELVSLKMRTKLDTLASRESGKPKKGPFAVCAPSL